MNTCVDGRVSLVLQDHVRLEANKCIAVLCFFSGTTDGLGKIQVHQTAFLLYIHDRCFDSDKSLLLLQQSFCFCC